ncbi:MAG: hypothetical protein ACE5F8_07365, partial [Woeseiaceae bacterium]
MRRTISTAMGLALVFATAIAPAEEASWDYSANVELQTRLFARDPLWVGQSSAAGQASVAATAEIRWRNADGNQRTSLIPYLRWDSTDSERSLVDLHEAYWAWEGDGVEVLVGANTVFWGVSESVHLVDIVNQTDLVADVDGEHKRGQPMINVEVQRDWGLISAYLLPYFRERTFPGADGRFRPPLPIDTDRPLFESSAGRDHVDVALRYSHYIGDIDIGVSLFSGTSREARFTVAADGTALLPSYDLIDQAGLDLQYTRDAWLWKLEAIVRNARSHTFAAAVGGFEYTFYQVGDSAADVGLLLEYQYDGRNAQEPVTVADNDVFVGTRLALNDTQDTAILAGVAYDAESGETFLNIEAERRIGDAWVFELRARGVSGADPGDITDSFVNDD